MYQLCSYQHEQLEAADERMSGQLASSAVLVLI